MTDMPEDLDHRAIEGTPRWVRVSVVVAIVLVAGFIVVHVTTGGLGHLHR